MNVDIFALINAICSLLQVLNQARHATDERTLFDKALEHATMRLVHDKEMFSADAIHMARNEKDWVRRVLAHSETTLAAARKLVSRSSDSKLGKISRKRGFRHFTRALECLIWVLDKRGEAGMYMVAISTNTLDLLMLRLQLLVESRPHSHFDVYGRRGSLQSSGSQGSIIGQNRLHASPIIANLPFPLERYQSDSTVRNDTLNLDYSVSSFLVKSATRPNR